LFSFSPIFRFLIALFIHLEKHFVDVSFLFLIEATQHLHQIDWVPLILDLSLVRLEQELQTAEQFQIYNYYFELLFLRFMPVILKFLIKNSKVLINIWNFVA